MLWLGALAATPALGQNKGLADPADPHAAVAPTRYVPMAVARSAAPPTSPAENWKAANQTVAAYDSMSLTMEMAAPAGAVAPTPAAIARPAQPAATPVPGAHSPHMHKAGQ